jgi:hypothetical protein
MRWWPCPPTPIKPMETELCRDEAFLLKTIPGARVTLRPAMVVFFRKFRRSKMVFIAVGIWFKSSKERIHYQKYKKYAGNDKRSSGWSNLVLCRNTWITETQIILIYNQNLFLSTIHISSTMEFFSFLKKMLM